MIDFIKISPKRHLLKTVSYRVVSSVIGFLVLWLFFGITVGVSFSLFELFCKPLLYYIHERIWYRHIKFGVTKVEDTIKPDLRIMESMSTGGDSTVTTTGPKRLVYTKKAG
jgi:uncharacterized membrane protein|tara:strand:+ start:387 stop:719 length:333 start_codon:yes stop_codon:yes gene_type:complete